MREMQKLGFSVPISSERSDTFYEQLLKDMHSAGVEAIELQLPEHDERVLGEGLRSRIGMFAYRSVHTSQLISPEASSEEINYYQRVARELGAHAIVVHPDSMASWGWLSVAFGDLVQPENMDREKKSARSPAEMQQIFAELPENTLMTLDLNHLWTFEDPADLVYAFHGPGMPEVGHYHLSGFQGFEKGELPHMPLCEAPVEQQSEMIKSIMDRGVPIISEGYGWRDIHKWEQEFNWITSQLA